MKLLCGPMSPEIVETVFAFSDHYRLPMGFVTSIGQVPPDGTKGYTGFDLGSFKIRLQELSFEFCCGDVKWCRDHLGRGGEDVHQAIIHDMPYAPAVTHIHHGELSYVRPIVEKYPEINFEVGPGEDGAWSLHDLAELFEWAVSQHNVKWISFPSGCLIVGLHNACDLDIQMIEMAKSYGIPMRGHNCDYADAITLNLLKMYKFSAIQTAPQLGVVQTAAYIAASLCSGDDISDWSNAVLSGDSWKKWVSKPHERLLAAGHYHYGELPDVFRETAKAKVKQAIWNVLEHFRASFCPEEMGIGGDNLRGKLRL